MKVSMAFSNCLHDILVLANDVLQWILLTCITYKW